MALSYRAQSALFSRQSEGPYSSPQPYSHPSQFNSHPSHQGSQQPNSCPPLVLAREAGMGEQAPPLPQRQRRGTPPQPLMGPCPLVTQPLLSKTRAQVVDDEDFTQKGTPRANIYYHLKNLFPENKVYQAMKQLPNETDPNRICQLLLRL